MDQGSNKRLVENIAEKYRTIRICHNNFGVAHGISMKFLLMFYKLSKRQKTFYFFDFWLS